jgi:hypothetical protein
MKLTQTVNEFFLARIAILSFRARLRMKNRARNLSRSETRIAREACVYAASQTACENFPSRVRAHRRGKIAREKNSLFFLGNDQRNALDDVIDTPQTTESFVPTRENSFLRSDEFHTA